jgi:predicted glutamine amidotransferase
MCRAVGYLGRPVALSSILYATDSSLARQAYSPRMMTTFLNLAGFGMAAWDPASVAPNEPFTYRVTTLPVFDRNLRSLAEKLAPSCLLAHVRGVTYDEEQVVSQQNIHPFRYRDTKVTLAHNGRLREFARMKYDLVARVRPELARRVEGTTDSEWIYALLLSQLRDPFALPGAAELVDATIRTLSIIREVRARNGIEISSPANLFVSTGRSLVVTRFSFDYGWYPDGDELLETDLPYVSLWYTLGDDYRERDGEWAMVGEGPPSSLMIASEPLTRDTSTWLEAPEYSIVSASLDDGVLTAEISDLEL